MYTEENMNTQMDILELFALWQCEMRCSFFCTTRSQYDMMIIPDKDHIHFQPYFLSLCFLTAIFLSTHSFFHDSIVSPSLVSTNEPHNFRADTQSHPSFITNQKLYLKRGSDNVIRVLGQGIKSWVDIKCYLCRGMQYIAGSLNSAAIPDGYCMSITYNNTSIL